MEWKHYKTDLTFLLVALSVVALDQATKALARSRLADQSVQPTSFLTLELVRNTGASFGVGQGYNTFFIIVTLLILSAIMYYYTHLRHQSVPVILMGLIAGGAVGNVIDRVAFGHVWDFISFSFWPAFNIADSAITIGTLALIIYLWKRQ